MSIQVIKGQGEMVVLSREEYEKLRLGSPSESAERLFDESEREADEESFSDEFVQRLLDSDAPLREWRQYRGLTQSRLAEAAGVRQATISAIENGRVSPSVATARRIADALGCDLDDLF